ncbi:MAG: DNA mismatch repair protein MutT, partial [bacterium]|nr:DNA mismatch repair protein MutT [bacterium]
NVKKYGNKHYAHIGLAADWKSGEPRVLEPEKRESWDWYAIDALPQPLFEMCRLTIESIKTGQHYFDS